MHGAPRKYRESTAKVPRKREKSMRRAEDATYLRPVRPSRLRPAQTRRTRVKSAETIRYFR